ncbi:putative phage tail protein [Paracandidimonas soli]|uniref:putative phage tail protein n=1 Tax=Paracandidimonas soli TaxID=1917182 RepID=UPI003610950A
MGVKTEGDYYRQLLQLLPLGPAWDSDLNPGVHGVLRAAAREFARIDARADDLLGEMVPTGVRELLPDWERVMGLPDRCTAVQPQFWQRRAEVVRRFGAVGEQRPAYFIQIAALMGYPGARSSSTGRRALALQVRRCSLGDLGAAIHLDIAAWHAAGKGLRWGLRCGVIALG